MDAQIRRTVALAVTMVLLVGLGIAGVLWFQWQQVPVTVVSAVTPAPAAPPPRGAAARAGGGSDGRGHDPREGFWALQ